MADQPNEPTERDWSEFIPDVDLPIGTLHGGVEIIKNFGILMAYSKWCGKSEPKPGKTESIMVSCPFPQHIDKHPSAWLNSDKDVWFCGACSKGGDIIDLGAIHFSIEGYKEDATVFTQLIELMLESMGVNTAELRAKNAELAHLKDSNRIEQIESTEEVASEKPSSPTVDEEEHDDELLEQLELVPLRWEDITSHYPNTFLDVWMRAATPSTVPNEYLFWNGVQMVGLAVARDCHLMVGTPVYPNFQLVLIGATGIGKSRSVSLAGQVILEAMPFNEKDPASRGCQLLGRPGSGEALYEMFSWQPDPLTSAVKPTRGLVDIDELSELMKAGSRKGSTLKEAVIALSDNRNRISHRTRSSSIEVVEPFMSLVTGGQPDAMQKIMDGHDAASGFANRFLYVSGTPKTRPRWGDQVKIDLTGVSDKLLRIRNWAGQRKRHGDDSIELGSAEAVKFDATLDWLDEVRRRPNGDMFARLELYAMKLVVILCANAMVTEATEQIIDDVHHLIETIVPTVAQITDAISSTEQEWYQDKVMSSIDRHKANGKNPPTRRDIIKSITASKRDRTKIGAAIAYLERINVITKVHLTGETPQIDRWRIS